MSPARKLPNEEGEYQCSLCREWKPRWEFRNRKSEASGIENACKKCMKPKDRARQLWKDYGISVEEFIELMDNQDGKCACCEVELDAEGTKAHKPHVDHCHTTKTVRGILCNKCNLAAGYLKDCSKLAQKLADYLNKWNS